MTKWKISQVYIYWQNFNQSDAHIQFNSLLSLSVYKHNIILLTSDIAYNTFYMSEINVNIDV